MARTVLNTTILNSDIDSHINTGTAAANEVLSYTGSDYDWVAQSEGIALTDFSVTTNSAGTAALSYSNSTGVFTYTPPDLSGYLTAETNDLTSAVTWANVPNANITESSVTQHQSALSITSTQVTDFGEAVDDQVNTLLQAGLGIDFTYDDANNELLIDSNHVEVNCTNNSGASIPKGTPVYQTGVSGNNIAIAPADADDSAKMPAIGITTSTLANGGEGTVVVLGVVNGLDTSSFSAGDTVYISTTAGGLTTTPPTGESGLIQNFGRVLKVNASSGSIAVMGAGRANAVPNLNDGNVFIGNSSNQAERRALVEADISDLQTYLTSYTETDTLDSVTGRGSSTTNNITVGNATITGNLTVQGTTTTLETATLSVEDKNITINYSTGDSSGSADGAGITIQDAVNSTTDATILWDATGDKFEFSHAVDVTGNITVSGTVDGRDLATDGSKLDGIEANADVTDATNVAAAGAVMDGDFTANGFMKRTGAGTYTVDTNNYLTSISVGGLSDITVTNVADNEVLAYDSTSSSWINQTAAEAGLATSSQGTLADSALQPADLSVTTNSAGTAALSYSNGVFTYTPPDLSSYLTAETNDLTSAVTWANVPNANITESSVTQHQAALSITESQISDLQTYLTGITGQSIENLSDVTTMTPTDGQVLTWDNTNSYWYAASPSGGSYGDSSVDTHLNTSTAATNEVLSWNGSDYDWVAQSGGIALTDLSVTTASAGTAALSYNNSTGAFTFTPPDLSSYLTAETNDLTSAVTWANVPNANITQSSVTQHQAALSITESQISDLGTYLTGITGENIGSLSDVTITSAAAGELLRYNGSAWVNSDPVAGRFSIVNSSSSAYVFTGSGTSSDSNPTLYLTRGQTYEFVVNASGHPFYIKTVSGTGTGNAYSDGVTNNGAETGTVTLAVQMDAPDTLYYNCSAHSAMAGTIYILDSTVDLSDFSVTTNSAGTAALSYSNGVFTYTPPDLSSYLTGITAQSIEDLSDVNTMTPTDGQVLTWDNANSRWDAATPSGGGSYSDSSVDSHLNTSTATANQVLSWTGSDYDWVAQSGGGGGASVTISDSPPSSPSAGDLWFESTGLILYVSYNDGDSTQWVQTNPSGAGSSASDASNSNIIALNMFFGG